jgi:methionyl-tRNA formyltransferase
MLRIFQAVEIDMPLPAPPGTLSIHGNALRVSAGNGSVSLLDVQLEGKKRMQIQDFLRGCRLQPGDRLG